jgi:hypothetical protein
MRAAWTATLPDGWDQRLAALVDPARVNLALETVALRPSEAGALVRAQQMLANTPRHPRYAKGPEIATADITRLQDKLTRMRTASTQCGRTDKDGTTCQHHRQQCPNHP